MFPGKCWSLFVAPLQQGTSTGNGLEAGNGLLDGVAQSGYPAHLALGGACRLTLSLGCLTKVPPTLSSQQFSSRR